MAQRWCVVARDEFVLLSTSFGASLTHPTARTEELPVATTGGRCIRLFQGTQRHLAGLIGLDQLFEQGDLGSDRLTLFGLSNRAGFAFLA